MSTGAPGALHLQVLAWLEYARELGIESLPRPAGPVPAAAPLPPAAAPLESTAAAPAPLERMRALLAGPKSVGPAASKAPPAAASLPPSRPDLPARKSSAASGSPLPRLGAIAPELLVSPPATPAQAFAVLPAPCALADVRAELGNCKRCRLHEGRTHLVFGVGSPEAELMFVGEGPGRDEDQQGEPFVGRAGQLLNDIIKAIHLRREEVYIANVVKCRPPENRTPLPDEIETCRGFLFKQIQLVRPKVVVTLGKPAAETLMRSSVSISAIRGQVFHFFGALLVPTFHPAYLLRNPARKREVWEDMKLVRDLLSGKAPVPGVA